MKKLPVIITIVILVVLAGGYFLYERYFHKVSASVWALVPLETVLVYEGSSCEKCINQLRNSPVLEIIEKAAFYKDESDSLKILRDFILSSQKQGTLISLHITRKDDFDFVFYTPVTQQSEQQFGMVMDQLSKMKGVRRSEREYNEVKIQELFFPEKKTFSWIQLDGAWAGSFTPVLIEDVIRTYNAKETNFKDELAAVYQLPRIKNDGGNLYLHLKNFTQWFSLFTTEQPSRLVQEFGQSALLDVKVTEDNKLVLNGFSLDSASHSSYILSAFSGQNPVPFTLKHFISNRTIMFANYGISNGANFSRDLNAVSNSTSERDTLAQLSKALKLDFDKLYTDLTGEVGVCWMESKGETTSKVLILHSTKGIDSWMKTLNALTDKLSVDTIYHEVYSSYELRELPVFRFPEKLFKPLITGFERSYYTSVGNTLFIGEDIEELKRFLDDIDKEETWGKSVAQNKFLEATLLESNVSLYINAPRVWNVLGNSLHPRWRDFIQQNQGLLNSLGMGAIQFSHLNDSYYTNVSWSFKQSGAKPGSPSTSERVITNFNNGVARFFVVKSHVDRNDEVMVQDSAKALSFISPDGKIGWTLQLDGEIAGDVTPVDFFKNGKLQYFFATPGVLHVVDRLGNYVKPFPVSIPEKDIEFVSIVDYDHSKKYRFLVSGRSGKLWMFDKEGKNLEGWQPRIVDESLSTPARHHRILGKDYLIAIRDDGFVYLMNRRGELLKNFPLDLNARPSGDYYLETGKTRSSTSFVVISRDGFKIKFNLEGKIQTREALLKNAPDAQFSLVREKDSKSYLVLRQEARQLTLYNEDLKELIVSDFVGNNPVDIQYRNFGAGKIYITITDLSQDLSFVYDGKGNLLTALPIESHSIEIRPADTDKPRIFYNYQKNLTLRPLP